MKEIVKPDMAFNIIFQQEKTPAHKGVLAIDKLRDMKYKWLEVLHCLSDLVSSDFHLFPNSKKLFTTKLTKTLSP